VIASDVAGLVMQVGPKEEKLHVGDYVVSACREVLQNIEYSKLHSLKNIHPVFYQYIHVD
jgi:NADPH:quinone reductase-like Zn-dependent oxidoreductase